MVQGPSQREWARTREPAQTAVGDDGKNLNTGEEVEIPIYFWKTSWQKAGFADTGKAGRKMVASRTKQKHKECAAICQQGRRSKSREVLEHQTVGNDAAQ